MKKFVLFATSAAWCSALLPPVLNAEVKSTLGFSAGYREYKVKLIDERKYGTKLLAGNATQDIKSKYFTLTFQNETTFADLFILNTEFFYGFGLGKPSIKLPPANRYILTPPFLTPTLHTHFKNAGLKKGDLIGGEVGLGLRFSLNDDFIITPRLGIGVERSTLFRYQKEGKKDIEKAYFTLPFAGIKFSIKRGETLPINGYVDFLFGKYKSQGIKINKKFNVKGPRFGIEIKYFISNKWLIGVNVSYRTLIKRTEPEVNQSRLGSKSQVVAVIGSLNYSF